MSAYRVFKATYTKNGVSKQSRKWCVEFRDQLHTVRRWAGFTSKPATDELGRNLAKLVEYHKATGGQVDPALSRWLSGLAAGIRTKLAEIGLLDPERVAASKLLTAHLEDFRSALAAKANTVDHVKTVTGRARRVLVGCGFRYFSDITATKVQGFLNDLRTDTAGRRGISAQTFNFHLGAVKQFSRWMVKNRRATLNPVDHLEPLNVKVDRRRDRRALTVDELLTLLATTACGVDRNSMCGPERSLLYRLAVESGLRSNELRTLTKESFRVDAEAPTVTVAAGNSKRRREDTLPLRPETASALREHLANKLPGASVFHIPKCRKDAAKMFRADMDAAGITFRDQDGRVVDFHALRHTFITNLARGNVHPKIAQALARHCTITLTMDRYSHTVLGEQADALNVLPDLSSAGSDAIRKTGTDNATPTTSRGKVLASCLASMHTKQGTQENSGGLSDATASKSRASCEVLVNEGKPHENEANGGVWKSNPLGALFTPPTGFEDQDRHQPCKHPQIELRYCSIYGTAEEKGFQTSRPSSAGASESRHLRPSRAVSSPTADKRATSRQQADLRRHL